jgi:hypothetical protein
MSYYVTPFTFGFPGSRVLVDVAVTDVSVIDLYEAIKDARASEEGILYDAIAAGSGLVDLGGGTSVGITVALVGSWQVKFPDGEYIARVSQGNLVGGPGGDPIAYSAGVQTLLIQSAASTVVNTSGGGVPTASQVANAVRLQSILGAQTPGTIGAALQETSARVAGSL